MIILGRVSLNRKTVMDKQQKLDNLRFELNRWQTARQLKIKAITHAPDPYNDSDEINTIIVLDSGGPILLYPGMKIVVVPEK
jgi:hypothetical protein